MDFRRVEEEFKWKMRSVYKKVSKGGGPGSKKRKAKEEAPTTTEGRGKGSVATGSGESGTKPKGKMEFERRVDQRSVNDVADAPPTLTALPRGAAAAGKSGKTMSGKSPLPVSAVQKRMMEEEREKAIERYRELKKLKTRQQGRLGVLRSEE